MLRASSTRMRRADPRHPDYHLLEELFKPHACLNGGRISIWVYHDGPAIREVVLSGHAEGRTCASATSILIEAAKQLDDQVEWMLTCGAAYFRLSPEQSGQPLSPPNFFDDPMLRALLEQGAAGLRPGFPGTRGPQPILSEMIEALQELANEKGLVEIFHQEWRRLADFRQAFKSRAGASPAQVVLPNGGQTAQVADYMPIIPGKSADGEPLIFKLEGWDFDCPAYQLVADHHLRTVQRELLGDALRRRRQYRSWLKEWTEQWVERLHWLPKAQADGATINVPGSNAELSFITQPATATSFLNEHAVTFLDRGQVWHKERAYLHTRLPFDRLSDSELDKKIRPTQITEVDFERGRTISRSATENDEAFTWRERILIHDPQMISHCLLYIRRMDWIIKPYEELRLKRDGSRTRQLGLSGRDREVRLVDEISRRIVIETMVRGWPSVYLEDKQDSDEFDVWAKKYRSHIWAIMAKQAKARGVALEILLEDNVVYDVRFNNDLGCTIQPLMLLDDATHAQLHGSLAGASVAVPLWSRRQSQEIPGQVLGLGADNRERAARLVERARHETTGAGADPTRAAESLRLALACHPAEAGKLILREWSRRLGRDTDEEFKHARSIVNAAELMAKQRYAEAARSVEEYLRDEPNPVSDAFVISAIIELVSDEAQRIEMRKAYLDYEQLAPRHEELALKLRPIIDRIGSGRTVEIMWALERENIPFSDLERLMQIQEKLTGLGERIKELQTELEKGTKTRRELIERALRKPASVRRQHPSLAQAAKMADETLRQTLETDCLYRQWSEAMHYRYGDIRRIIEVRGLLDILHALSMIAYRIDKDPNKTREQALDEMRRLSSALWLPGEIESDLRRLAEEFGKGSWDRLQSLQVLGVIREAISTCLSRMQDLLSSTIVTSAPLKEAMATRIHITQTIEAKYKTALDMLLTARVALSRCIKGQWVVCDGQLRDFPEDGRFLFNMKRGVISLGSGGKRTPLLRADEISDEEAAHISEIIADEELPLRLNRFASSLAEGLLASEVEPCREWRLWRDAMAALSRELIVTLSGFGYEANLMPEQSPPVSDSDTDFEERLNSLTPRNDPKADWSWSDMRAWGKLVGPSYQQTALQ
jgi:hypothetical protein